MEKPRVAIIMGSKSDWEVMKKAGETLDKFAISYESKVISAHRAPKLTTDYAQGAKARGIEVIIAGAGLAAHLPGVVAAQTSLPVIGVPIESKGLGGMDALLSIVQMPPGVPVACVGVDNARNAAFLAVRMMALKDAKLAVKIDEQMKTAAQEVEETRLD